MPVHGLPPRSLERTTKQRAASRQSGGNGLPLLVVAVAILLAISAALWWGVGLSWDAMTRSDTFRPTRWTLVLDGWVPGGERCALGLRLARERKTDSVLISGTRIAPGLWGSTLQVRAQVAESSLVGRVAELRHGASSTIEEARAAVAFFRTRGVDTVLLVTSDFHSDRAASVFRRIADGRPVFLSVPATEARLAQGWDRERFKTWLLEATKRLYWTTFERWTTHALSSSEPGVPWTAAFGSEAGASPLFTVSCPPAPVCPPPVVCPVCPVAETTPIVVPCPEAPQAKTQAKESTKSSSKASAKVDPKKKADAKSSSKGKGKEESKKSSSKQR